MTINRPLFLDGVRIALIVDWWHLAIGGEVRKGNRREDPLGQRINVALFLGPFQFHAEVNKHEWRWL